MVARGDTIKRAVLLIAVLLLSAAGVGCQSVLADNVNISVEICTGANAEPTLNLNYASGATTFYSPITINFSGAWLHSLSVEGNGGSVLGSSMLTFADNQTFSQTIDLVDGVNNLTLKYNGGCPKHDLARNLVVVYLPNGVSVNHIITNSGSPALTGKVGKNQRNIKVEIAGKTYNAVNNGDGTWILPAGTISPALVDGDYAVTLQLLDENTHAVLNTITETAAVVVRSTAPTIAVNSLETTNTSPSLNGIISSPTHGVSVVVNGQTYTAVNNGDGTWRLPAGTITPPLVDGNYDVTVNALDPVTQAVVATSTVANGLKIDTISPILTVTTPVTTDNRQPEIAGTIDDTTAVVTVTINGQTYTAVNNGDGTWRLPAGTIAPLASGEYDLIVRATDHAGNSAIQQLTFTVKAKNEIGFILPPHTGYVRINRVNIPSWLIYLVMIGLVWLVVMFRRRRQEVKDE